LIARVWHGCTKPEHADAYESHLKPELLPGSAGSEAFAAATCSAGRSTTRSNSSPSFLGLARRRSGHRAARLEKAVIPEDRLPLLSRYDARAAHYEVVSTNEPVAT
jgi:hypothetical protein